MNETTNSTATALSTIVDGYFAMWNETGRAQRRAAIAATWTPDGSYVDPMFAVQGTDALEAMVEGVQAQFPGYRFRLTSSVDAHHDRARWDWELASPDGSPPAASGIDLAVLAPDGKLRSVTGFFAPAAGS